MQGFIEYAEYIENQGACRWYRNSNAHLHKCQQGANRQMFELLAETGKLIKISELDIGVEKQTTQATDEDYIAQAEMYQFVVEKYFEIIPAAQRYGITIWSPRDSPASSSWRAGEPIGIWTEGYNRRRAYAGFAEGSG